MVQNNKIFFSGTLDLKRSTGWQRRETLKELGRDVVSFAEDSYLRVPFLGRVLQRVPGFRGNIFDSEGLKKFNSDFLDAIVKARPGIAWIEKALLLFPETLQEARHRLPETFFVCFQDDDPLGPFTLDRPALWKNFIASIPLYDLHFVKKSYDLQEFKAAGAREVRQFMHGVYWGLFSPSDAGSISPSLKHDVVFVGATRDRRVGTVSHLVIEEKIPVQVYGNGWKKTPVFKKYPELFHSFCSEEAYTHVVGGSKISLGFVAHSQRDEYNGRTFEIPACRGFFLAERTPAHLQLYEEGKEAEFFDSPEECADKIRYYLMHEEQRQAIAQAGYQRCLSSDYSMKRRLGDALRCIREVRD